MSLTESQLETLKSDIDANPGEFGSIPMGPDGHQQIADVYNVVVAPDFWVFKTSLTRKEVVDAMDWATDYATFKDDLPAIEFLLSRGGGEPYDPTEPGAREALSAVFAGANSTRGGLLVAVTRLATRGEKLFAVTTTGPGGGDGSLQAASAALVVQGNLSGQDVEKARGLP